MKTFYIKAFTAMLVFLGLILSCEPDTTAVVGEDWINNGTKVFYIDTFTVEASTFKFDSVAVSNTSRLLIGSYQDEDFGRVQAKSYLQFYAEDFDIDNDAVYDSIALILDYDNYFYNDTTSMQTFNVYRVLENLNPPDDYFYNTTNFKTEDSPIASVAFRATPKKADSLQLKLNDTFGLSLFKDIQKNDINNYTELITVFKGLVITPDDSNTAMLGFLKSSKLRLYYSMKSEIESTQDYFDLEISSGNSFHNISTSFSNSYIKAISTQNQLVSSKQTNNTCFIQSGSGLATRINIPFIEQIHTISGSGLIMDANLSLSLKRNSVSKTMPVQDSLTVYIIDQKSQIISELTNSDGDVIYGRKSTDQYDDNYISYNVSIKYFLNLKLKEINGNKLYLGIISNRFNDSVDRYIFEGEASENKTLKTKVELNYAIYNDE